MIKQIMHARSVMADMRHPQLKLAVQGQDNISTIAMMNDDSNTYRDSLQIDREQLLEVLSSSTSGDGEVKYGHPR